MFSVFIAASYPVSLFDLLHHFANHFDQGTAGAGKGPSDKGRKTESNEAHCTIDAIFVGGFDRISDKILGSHNVLRFLKVFLNAF